MILKCGRILKGLFPEGYEAITYGTTGKVGKKMKISLTFHGYGNAAPSISQDMHRYIEKCITSFFKDSAP